MKATIAVFCAYMLAAAATAETVKPIGAGELSSDLKRLTAYSGALEGMLGEMNRLCETVRGTKRGHFTSNEHDRIENLLFRYLGLRESLWEIVNRYRDYKDNFTESADQTKAFILAFNAALNLAYYSSILVQTFMEEPAVVEKLNERYYRSDVPRGTYDTIFRSLTDINNVRGLRAAWVLYEEEIGSKDSMVRRIGRQDPAYAQLIAANSKLYRKADSRIEDILDKNSLLLPAVRNALRHSAVAELAMKSKESVGDGLYTIRGILFVNVSRIRAPMSANLKLTDEQLKQVKALMKPGDIVLTYSSGYMSNIFLPGKFKHGLTYVGSPEERQALKVAAAAEKIAKSKQERIAADIAFGKLASGEEADLIEAVAEGVIFNSLERITDEHVNRLLVLRPRLPDKELAGALNTVFLLLGDTYDFHFDFDDGTHQCCTEVIYRALNRRGPISFELTGRMGVPTLSADDIIQNFLKSESGKEAFEFVVLTECDESAGSKAAVVRTGDEGLKRLRDLMAAVSE